MRNLKIVPVTTPSRSTWAKTSANVTAVPVTILARRKRAKALANADEHMLGLVFSRLWS